MMMSPELYSKKIKNYSKEELADEKAKLEQYIEKYNNNSLKQELVLKPSPSTVVKVYEEYLKEIEKINK